MQASERVRCEIMEANLATTVDTEDTAVNLEE
jgi:hypothetical protein